MGKNNRARRAANARRRAGERGTRPGAAPHDHHAGSRPNPGRPFEPSADRLPPAQEIARLLEAAPAALSRGEHSLVDAAVDRLCVHQVGAVRAACGAELRRWIVRLWDSGWQPAELVRQVRRSGSAPTVALVRRAIAADHAARGPDTLDPRWAAQLPGLDLAPVDPAAPTEVWVEAWATELRLDRFSELTSVVELLLRLRTLRPIDVLIPPPGAGRAAPPRRPPAAGRGPGVGVDDTVLAKIRALLAKAESTSFEAEAEAFTAKAQELMLRHAIDAALVAQGDVSGGAGEVPVTIRVAIDDPYVDAKSLLLQVVAVAGRCRAVFHAHLSVSSVIGFAVDVAAFELLYTSLLVQAQTALSGAALTAPAGSRPRSRSFRSAFLLAYAHRIGQRLEEINAAVIADTERERGSSVLPALIARDAVVDAVIEDRFGALTSQRVRGGGDAYGWVSGRQAADAAQLAGGYLSP